MSSARPPLFAEPAARPGASASAQRARVRKLFGRASALSAWPIYGALAWMRRWARRTRRIDSATAMR